jgi:hypothetical protein
MMARTRRKTRPYFRTWVRVAFGAVLVAVAWTVWAFH